MNAPAERQRIDKWLWHARMARTRTAAADLVSAGHVRINGQRVVQAAKAVRIGDVLTIALERDVRLLKIAGIAERRGPFEIARRLYEDLGAATPRQGGDVC
jgi:ribosome-associated heat shock protein Hsp15